ncbi:4-oxalomesaconate tautomerase [Thioclava sp. SK-1]|uniref:4-oxalomesaconate tautomerase n=1 Tax=Thioclava sp. SK-1 TaxID=1889770 RepID=UPI000825B30E|nr:4-oxalomesaconate tautomerase [Thioclava sp. SK-1]OCX66223.1 4-oxalomesaconate tautomerase [Thioclava sp. SK-1]
MGLNCLWLRAGTSKGAYFVARDLPTDPAMRDKILLQIMGSPDPHQIDGIGGADPLCSKVAILAPSSRPDADIDYLFLQIFVDQPIISDAQGCGNILAGVGPAAIEMGLIHAQARETTIRIHMLNTGDIARATVQTPDGAVTYRGDTCIDGVPGSAAPIRLLFDDIAGSMCGALLPTGRVRDVIQGVTVTAIDNGMPVVLLDAAEFGLDGAETRMMLEENSGLKTRLEAIRLEIGPMMGLGDVSNASVPKMTLLSAPRHGGVISTQSFIPHRAHASIGVFAAISVATGCCLEGAVGYDLAQHPAGTHFAIEHPSGAAEVVIERDPSGQVTGAGTVRTARKLFQGQAFARD